MDYIIIIQNAVLSFNDYTLFEVSLSLEIKEINIKIIKEVLYQLILQITYALEFQCLRY